MQFLAFTHEQDVDGIFCAAILKIAFPDCEIVLTNYGLEKMKAAAEIIRNRASLGSGMLIIADVGVNQESYLPMLEALRFSKENGWENVWLDHHVWPEQPRMEIASACTLLIHSGDSPKKCAAELCCEKFAPGNPLAQQLATIAHRTDFPDSDKFPIPPLTALISYYLGFPELNGRLYSVIVENVRKGILWESQMQADVIAGFRLIEASIERSKADMTVQELSYGANGKTVFVAVAKAEAFVSRSVLLGRIMDESNAQVAVAFTEDGKVSIRKRGDAPEEIDCSKIALEFKEGGGHVGAAGGFLRMDPREKGDEAAVAEVRAALMSYFARAA